MDWFPLLGFVVLSIFSLRYLIENNTPIFGVFMLTAGFCLGIFAQQFIS